MARFCADGFSYEDRVRDSILSGRGGQLTPEPSNVEKARDLALEARADRPTAKNSNDEDDDMEGGDFDD